MQITHDGYFFYVHFIQDGWVHGIPAVWSGANYTTPVAATTIDNNLLSETL